jgi:hypothetical protein
VLDHAFEGVDLVDPWGELVVDLEEVGHAPELFEDGEEEAFVRGDLADRLDL